MKRPHSLYFQSNFIHTGNLCDNSLNIECAISLSPKWNTDSNYIHIETNVKMQPTKQGQEDVSKYC